MLSKSTDKARKKEPHGITIAFLLLFAQKKKSFLSFIFSFLCLELWAKVFNR